MGLATPTSIMVATGRAAQMGVLFRKGDALQLLRDAAVVAVDKTGTLTVGKPQLTDLVVAPAGYCDGEGGESAVKPAHSKVPGTKHPRAPIHAGFRGFGPKTRASYEPDRVTCTHAARSVAMNS